MHAREPAKNVILSYSERCASLPVIKNCKHCSHAGIDSRVPDAALRTWGSLYNLFRRLLPECEVEIARTIAAPRSVEPAFWTPLGRVCTPDVLVAIRAKKVHEDVGSRGDVDRVQQLPGCRADGKLQGKDRVFGRSEGEDITSIQI